MPRRGDRRRQILEALALRLESHPGERLTTARLAAELGVSEAALYRHFPSKARMYEALVEFAEDAVFSRVNELLEGETDAAERSRGLLAIVIRFAERNPGINRVLAGDALAGEDERVRRRARNYLARIDTQLRQVLREDSLAPAPRLRVAPDLAAAVLGNYLEGALARLARAVPGDRPPADREACWAVLAAALFRPAPP